MDSDAFLPESHEAVLGASKTPMFTQATHVALEEYEMLASREIETGLPAFDRCLLTARSCFAGLVMAWSAVCLCVALSVYVLQFKGWEGLLAVTRAVSPEYTPVSAIQAEWIPLLVNFVLTFTTDSLGFIHSTSLRWALDKEGKLEFNTNLRLFTSAVRSRANRWYINVVYILCLVLSYAATSSLFNVSYFTAVSRDPEDSSKTVEDRAIIYASWFSGIAAAGLGLGLLGQAIICTWCYLVTYKEIPTWSSNALNNTLVLRHKGLQHRQGRCLISLAPKQQLQTPHPTRPRSAQPAIIRSSPSSWYVIMLVWSLSLLGVVWTIAVYFSTCEQSNDDGSCVYREFDFAWTKDKSSTRNTLSFSLEAFSGQAQGVIAILLSCGLQGIQTIALHCTELLVNTTRDEETWKSAAQISGKKSRGAQISTSPFRSAISSWQNIFLFVAKALLHWLLGQAAIISTVNVGTTLAEWDEELPDSLVYVVTMMQAPVFTYAMISTAVAMFATYLALCPKHSSQPSAWGHYQTLADLIDDWGMEDGRFWWGDKGYAGVGDADGDVRHAGTSCRRFELDEIQMDKPYAGKMEWVALIRFGTRCEKK